MSNSNDSSILVVINLNLGNLCEWLLLITAFCLFVITSCWTTPWISLVFFRAVASYEANFALFWCLLRIISRTGNRWWYCDKCIINFLSRAYSLAVAWHTGKISEKYLGCHGNKTRSLPLEVFPYTLFSTQSGFRKKTCEIILALSLISLYLVLITRMPKI